MPLSSILDLRPQGQRNDKARGGQLPTFYLSPWLLPFWSFITFFRPAWDKNQEKKKEKNSPWPIGFCLALDGPSQRGQSEITRGAFLLFLVLCLVGQVGWLTNGVTLCLAYRLFLFHSVAFPVISSNHVARIYLESTPKLEIITRNNTDKQQTTMIRKCNYKRITKSQRQIMWLVGFLVHREMHPPTMYCYSFNGALHSFPSSLSHDTQNACLRPVSTLLIVRTILK